MRPRGVTLLELVCVLAVVMLLVAAAVNMVAPMLRASRLRSGADGVLGALRSARALALAGGEVYAVRFDTGSEPDQLLVYGSLRVLPGGHQPEAWWKSNARYAGVSARLSKDVCVTPRGGAEGDTVNPIWFRPDGSAGGSGFDYEVRGAGGLRRRIMVLESTGLALEED